MYCSVRQYLIMVKYWQYDDMFSSIESTQVKCYLVLKVCPMRVHCCWFTQDFHQSRLHSRPLGRREHLQTHRPDCKVEIGGEEIRQTKKDGRVLLIESK